MKLRPASTAAGCVRIHLLEESNMKQRITRGPLSGALGALGALAAIAAPSTVSAQPGSQAGTLEEIVVTARFREERLQETPIAITALTAADIEARDFSNAAQIGYTVPNTYFQKAQAAFGNTLVAFIRGVGQNDFNFAFEPGVAMYIDDVYHATLMGSFFDLLDLERVEVLRGPQGTLFGRNSIGGAMRLVSRPPRGDGSGEVQASVGDFNRVDVRASYDFAFTDNVFARVSAAAKRRDGYVDLIDFACERPAEAGTLPSVTANRGAGCRIGTLGGEDSTGARVALRYVPSDRVQLSFTADFQDDQSESQADIITAVSMGTSAPPFAGWDQMIFDTYGVRYDDRFVTGSNYKSYATFRDPITGMINRPISTVTSKGLSGTLDWDISDNMSAKFVYATRGYESEFATDHDGSPLAGQEVNGWIDFDQDTYELQLSGYALNDRLDWTVGLFYYDSDVTSAQTVFLPAFAGPSGILVNGFNVQENKNRSIYSQFVYGLSDRTNLTFGLRHSEDDKSVNFDNTIVVTQLSNSDDSTDYRIGADWSFGQNKLLYASYATGYRPLAYNPRPFQPSQLAPVSGEELGSYEVGVKGDFADGRLRFNTAVFYSDYKRRIVPRGGQECLKNPDGTIIPGDAVANPEPGGPATCSGLTSLTRYVNVPGTVQGVEFELNYRPTGALLLTAGAGYTDWDSPDIASGSRPAFVPEWNANASLQYDFYLGRGGVVTPRVDAYFQTEICSGLMDVSGGQGQSFAVNPNTCTPSYELVNLRLGYRPPAGDWSLSAGVTNAANKDHLLNIFDLTAFGQPFRQAQPGRPREAYLSFSKSF
jgi:iron complex outermembrane recepter protein